VALAADAAEQRDGLRPGPFERLTEGDTRNSSIIT
jgi:hypothetical protein